MSKDGCVSHVSLARLRRRSLIEELMHRTRRVAVKTEKRALTQEETEERLQRCVVFSSAPVLAAVASFPSRTQSSLLRCSSQNEACHGMSCRTGLSQVTDRERLTRIFPCRTTRRQPNSGLMKGWKNSQFNVPWMLAKTTGLGGSRHDKNKDEWEKKCASPAISRLRSSSPLCEWSLTCLLVMCVRTDGPKQKRRVD